MKLLELLGLILKFNFGFEICKCVREEGSNKKEERKIKITFNLSTKNSLEFPN